MKFFKKNFLLLLAICFLTFTLSVNATANPYGKYQDLYGVKTVRCTWYAWEQAYTNAGVALPGWGNAQEWYNSAAMSGYSVGKEAKPNSIAVWSSSDSYGHVAYVVSVDPDGKYMTVNEGGIPTTENEGIVNGSRPSTSASNLIGFIYLDDAPSSSNSSSTSSNQNSNNTSSSKKSSNNNLDSLSIDIADFAFDKEILEYDLTVSYDTQIITIKATAEDAKSIVTGAGQKALKVGNNTYNIVVTAEDGTKKEYIINITRENENIKAEEKIVNDSFSPKKSKNIFLIIGVVSVVIIIALVIFLIRHKKHK